MADFTQILQEINDDINTNGVGAITGAKLNQVLRDIISSVADNLPQLYSEDVDNESARIDASYIRMMCEMFSINDGLYTYRFSPETGFEVVSLSGELRFVVKEDLFSVKYDDDWELYFDKTIFKVRMFDGSDPYELKFDLNNGLVVGSTNVSFKIEDLDENKADKVSGATAGDFAGLDAYGNLTDSGSKASDFATAAQGAKADTAYQMPSGGIPSSDMTNAVQTSLGKADTAYQKPATGIPSSDMSTAVQTSLGLADTAIQDVSGKADKVVGATSGDVATLDSNGNLTDSGLSVFDFFVMVEDASTPPASMSPNTVYQYGTLSGDTTFPPLATPTEPDIANVYCWTFTTPATAPTITWPVAITAWAGGSAPTINASKSYEVSVMNGLATIIES